VPVKQPPNVSLPLLLWIDDVPENNEFMIEYAKEYGVTVITLETTAAAKQWIRR
jgi:hypothetical protein